MATGKNTKLLVRSPVLPDESLPSYLGRLSLLNNYPTPRFVENIASQQAKPYSDAWFATLSVLTDQPDVTLFAATHLSWANIMSARTDIPAGLVKLSDGRSYNLLAKKYRGHVWAKGDVTYCPLCLKENLYHHLTWFHVSTAACLAHKVLLIRRCADCGTAVSPYDILTGKCSSCEALLQDAPPISIAHDSFSQNTQSLMQSLWGQTPGSYKSHNIVLPSENPRVIYALIFTLVRPILRVMRGLSLLHNPNLFEIEDVSSLDLQTPRWPIGINYILISTAVKVLTNWPDGFYEFLASYSESLAKGGRSVTRSKFTFVESALQSTWSGKDFDFVRLAVSEFFDQHFVVSPSIPAIKKRLDDENYCPYLKIEEAAHVLQVSVSTVRSLCKNGTLSKSRIRTDMVMKEFHVVDRREVITLSRSELWATKLTIPETASFLGTNVDTVMDLASLAMLDALCIQESSSNESKQGFFYRGSAAFLLTRIEQVVQKEIDDPRWLTLEESRQYLSDYGYNAAMVVKAILEGDLQAMWAEPLLNQILISHDSLFDFQTRLYEEHFSLTVTQVAERLSVSTRAIYVWINLGVMPSHINSVGKHCIIEDDLQWFSEQYISIKQATEVLNVRKKKLLIMLEKSGVVPALRIPNCVSSSRNLYLRSDLARLLPMMSLYTISTRS